MDPNEQFRDEVRENIEGLMRDKALQRASKDWIRDIAQHRYAYNFSWLGRPIIQLPQDMVAIQELIWQVRPDLVIEAGIAHGGSLILSASVLAMLDYCDAVEAGMSFDPKATRRRVLGIDIDIRAHNRAAINAHPMAHRIDMIEGSSIAPETIARVRAAAKDSERVMVILDSNHTHEHVLAELEAYAPMVGVGSYCIVFDTLIEDMPAGSFPDRPWDVGDNPKTAVWEYLRRLAREGREATDGGKLDLEIDKAIECKLLITVAPDGYLKRI